MNYLDGDLYYNIIVYDNYTKTMGRGRNKTFPNIISYLLSNLSYRDVLIYCTNKLVCALSYSNSTSSFFE